MPEPNRAPWRVHKDLAALYGWQVVESGLALVIECDGCGRVSEWPHRLVKRNLAKLHRVRMPEIASRLRCAKCRCNWVKVSGKREAEGVALRVEPDAHEASRLPRHNRSK